MSILEKIGLQKNTDTEAALEKESAKEAKVEHAVSKKEGDPRVMPSLEDFKVILEEQGDITVEELEAMTGMHPEAFMQSITGDENIQIKSIKDFHEAIKNKQSAPKEEEYRDTGLRKLANNNFIKAGVLSLILFLKFAPHAEAAHTSKPETEGKKFNTEAAKKTETKIDGGDDKTYHLDGPNPGDTLPLEKLAKLDLTNSYDTDKADILSDHRAAIETEVHNFLDGVDSDNYRDLMTHVWKISGSSDERLTNTWEGGNEELTNARILAAEKIIKEAIGNYDYSHSGLNAKQIEDLKNKPFVYDSYSSQNGPEKGVTYLTDLKNPDTGENYTADQIKEIKEHDEKKYYSLLDKCRYIKVNLMAEGDVIKPIPNKPAELKTNIDVKLLERKLPELKQYKFVLVLQDKSGSMKVSKEAMAKYLAENYNPNTKVTTATFSDHLDDFRPLQDMLVASESLNEARNDGNSSERTIACTIDALKLSPAQEHSGEGLALVGTDEALQRVSLNDLQTLQSLATEKNVDVKFLIVHIEDGERITESVPLGTIMENFTDPNGVYQKTKANLERYVNNPRISHSSRRDFQQRLNHIDDNGFTMKKLTIEDSEGEKKEIELAIYQ